MWKLNDYSILKKFLFKGCEDSFEKSKDKSGNIAACQSGCEFQTPFKAEIAKKEETKEIEKPEKIEKVEQPEKVELPEKSEDAEQPEKVEQIEKAEDASVPFLTIQVIKPEID